MKKLLNVMAPLLIALLILPAGTAFAQTSKVPITYEGDTHETIARRIEWIKKAKEEKEVMWWTSIRPNQLSEITSEFNKIYPFIKIKYWQGRREERTMKIEVEHSMNRVTADLCDAGGMEHYPRWRKIGLVEKFVHIVPEINKMNPRRYSKHMDWIQPGNNAVVPMYNTNLVSTDEAPKRWEDLLDPKWKGHIGMTTDLKAWYVLALAEGGWGVEKTEAFLKKLRKQNPIWAKGHSAGTTLLIAGEFKIFAENFLRYLFRDELKTAPIDWARVEPVPITGGTFFLTQKAPHPNSARLFLEWIFSPQGAVVFENTTGYGAADPGSKTRLSKTLAGLDIIYRDEAVLKKVAETGMIKRINTLLGIEK